LTTFPAESAFFFTLFAGAAVSFPSATLLLGFLTSSTERFITTFTDDDADLVFFFVLLLILSGNADLCADIVLLTPSSKQIGQLSDSVNLVDESNSSFVAKQLLAVGSFFLAGISVT